MGPQQQILEMIRSRRRVSHVEILREVATTDARKIISRLRRQGFPIENVSPPGELATYVWREEQMRLL